MNKFDSSSVWNREKYKLHFLPQLRISLVLNAFWINVNKSDGIETFVEYFKCENVETFSALKFLRSKNAW